jgi:hypothetical protein
MPEKLELEIFLNQQSLELVLLKKKSESIKETYTIEFKCWK